MQSPGSCPSEETKQPDSAMGAEVEGSSEVVTEETWARRATARQRQIAIGKARPEYRHYERTVPMEERRPGMPQTPNPYEQISKRAFDRQLSLWRRQLHEFEPDGSGNVRSDGQELSPGKDSTHIASEPPLSFSPSEATGSAAAETSSEEQCPSLNLASLLPPAPCYTARCPSGVNDAGAAQMMTQSLMAAPHMQPFAQMGMPPWHPSAMGCWPGADASYPLPVDTSEEDQMLFMTQNLMQQELHHLQQEIQMAPRTRLKQAPVQSPIQSPRRPAAQAPGTPARAPTPAALDEVPVPHTPVTPRKKASNAAHMSLSPALSPAARYGGHLDTPSPQQHPYRYYRPSALDAAKPALPQMCEESVGYPHADPTMHMLGKTMPYMPMAQSGTCGQPNPFMSSPPGWSVGGGTTPQDAMVNPWAGCAMNFPMYQGMPYSPTSCYDGWRTGMNTRASP